MLLDKIKEQDFARTILQNHLTRDRISQTYLFTGNQFSGKEDLAIAFACALNSEEKDPFEDTESISSKKIQEGNHPDVFILGEDETVRSIKIDEIRKAITQVSLKPYEGKYKVFILMGAERLTLDAANALLKVLEEPPQDTVFMLLVENKGHLLETIQSRCFEVRLKPLSCGDIDLSLTSAGLGQLKWEDFLENYEKSSRDEMKVVLDQMMSYFREQLQKQADRDEVDSKTAYGYLKAIDFITETKEALMDNANQKLAMTRLSMQLKKLGV